MSIPPKNEWMDRATPILIDAEGTSDVGRSLFDRSFQGGIYNAGTVTVECHSSSA
jgi:hypothetical protein